jgi:hypothetical protein
MGLRCVGFTQLQRTKNKTRMCSSLQLLYPRYGRGSSRVDQMPLCLNNWPCTVDRIATDPGATHGAKAFSLLFSRRSADVWWHFGSAFLFTPPFFPLCDICGTKMPATPLPVMTACVYLGGSCALSPNMPPCNTHEVFATKLLRLWWTWGWSICPGNMQLRRW